MNIAELSIRKSTITWVMTIVLVVVGWSSFNNLSRLEDPEFTIKEAKVVTPYPGASPTEVEEEVTEVIEKAVQQMGQLFYVESRSSRGISFVSVTIKDKYDKNGLPQVWDELRRKVGDAQSSLPPGAGPSVVNDDFGDVYGIYLAITGEGYSYPEIYETAKFLQRELLLVPDVKRIAFYGNLPEAVFIEMRREKMAELGISPGQIYSALAAKNLAATSGNVTIGEEYITVSPTGEYTSEEQFGDLLISGGGDQSLVFLKDVADVRRGYQEPASRLLRQNGMPAIGLAISTADGGNVVKMGTALEARLAELKGEIPLGMELGVISYQSNTVEVAVNDFMKNLIAAVVIVIVVLLIFMGLRSGLIIGAILFVTIMGTFIFMGMKQITLERISLGALIISLGMLVDNAIVVTDGMRVRMQQGIDAIRAAREVVGQTAIPLLGATVIAVTAFASIGVSQDSTGEYCRSLFLVILISLMLSWVTAVTVTPLFCKVFLKVKGKKGEGDGDGDGEGDKDKNKDKEGDPYGGAIYTFYKGFLTLCMKRRWITVAVTVALFVLALVGFGSVKQSFFPDSTRPQFYVDFWFPASTHIDESVRKMERAEAFLFEQEGVGDVTSIIGGGQIRFLLTYPTEEVFPNFTQILVSVDDYKKIPGMIEPLQNDLEEIFPEAIINVRRFVNGPATGGKIQVRLSGPDPALLRGLAADVEAIMESDPDVKAVRNDWQEMVKVIQPEMAETQANRLGITRLELAQGLESAVEGTPVGVYREGDELLPIIARSPLSERTDLDNLEAIQIWSPVARTMIPAGQVVSGFETVFENPHIQRRSRTRTITVNADPRGDALPAEILQRIKPEIEKTVGVDLASVLGKSFDPGEDPYAGLTASTVAVNYNDKIPLAGRPGFYMAWGGEIESSAKATNAIMGKLPTFFGLMVLIVIFLFNSIKKTLIIWLCVPLAIIGVTVGLLIFRQPFGFMALLGLLSLAGMLIKNAIVLIDQIDLNIKEGIGPFDAIVDSGVSRLIPVSMAAITTILGMLPLLTDAFFISMAVTIMFGLGFATVLTLIVVPVLYAIFFRVPNPGATPVKGGNP